MMMMKHRVMIITKIKHTQNGDDNHDDETQGDDNIEDQTHSKWL